MPRMVPLLLLPGLMIAAPSCGSDQTSVEPPIQGPEEPSTPEEDRRVWEADLHTVPGATVTGDDLGAYRDGVERVQVSVRKIETMGSANDFETLILLKLSNLTGRWVAFNGVSLSYLDPGEYQFVDPDMGTPCCHLPLDQNPCAGRSCNDCAYCTCLEDFMNGSRQPAQGYDFLVQIHAFDHELEAMGVEESYKLGSAGHFADYIDLTLRYQASQEPPLYHSIEGSKSAHLGPSSRHPFSLWITRTDTLRWRVDVGRPGDSLFLFVEEFFYGDSSMERVSTLFRGGYFRFSFDLAVVE